MGIYNKIKNLEVNHKIIFGFLSFLFLNPLFFAYLTIYSYKEVKNKILNGVLTVIFLSLTFLSGLVYIAMFFPDDKLSDIDIEKENQVIDKVETPLEVVSEGTSEDSSENKDLQMEEDLTFKVLSVTDGDTIRIDYYGESTPVRFIGVDAPEINHQDEPVQCYGPEAKAYIEDKIGGKWIKLEKEPKDNNTDNYGRLLRYVILEDGTNLGEIAIKEGYLLESTYTEGYKYQNLYRDAETEAKNNKVGFWNPSICNGDVYTGTYKDPAKNNVEAVEKKSPAISDNTTIRVTPIVTAPTKTSDYICDCSKTCSKMSSCVEAQYQLNTCGCSARDGDKDGIACDSDCQ